MADLELLSRNMRIDQHYEADVSSGEYLFGNWLPVGLFERFAVAHE